ncbi:MAG TPA: YIP1 family protein [Anaeromyxobacter sp.]
MLARCARCQGTFTTDRYGIQVCPHCGSEVLLTDPNAAAPPAPPPAPAAEPPREAAPPPTAGPPPGGSGPPPGWGPPPPGWPPPGAWGAPPPPPPPEAPAPFAERKRLGFFASFYETWKLVAGQPSAFFRRVRVDRPGSAVLFAVIAATLASWVSSFFAFATSSAAAGRTREALERLPPQFEQWRRMVEALATQMTPADLVGRMVAAPVFVLAAIYVVSGVVHLLLLLFRGAPRGFGATLTAAGYAGGLSLVGVVPACGGFIGAIWVLVVLVIGLGETQRCGTGKATAAVLLPGLLLCGCACAAGVAAFLAAMSGSGGGAISL